MAAEHGPVRRSLFKHLDHIVAELVPRLHPSWNRRQLGASMPAQVDRRAMRLPAQRLQKGCIGDGVKTGGVEEHHLNRLHGIAKSDAGHLTVTDTSPKPAHAPSASKHTLQ